MPKPARTSNEATPTHEPLCVWSSASHAQLKFSDPAPPNFDRNWRRRHGFQRPIPAIAVASWCLYPVMVATLLGLFPQFIPSSPLLIPTLALIAALVFLHIVLFFGTIFIDPQDLATKQSHRDTTYTHRRGFPVINAYSRICGICCVDVDARTYHCKQCNKCTAGFDHHCVWVNCCVGEANYRWFIGVVGVGWVLVTVFTAATAWIVGVYSQERTRFEYVVTSLVSKSPPGMSKAIVAYVCLMLIVGILSFMAISALLWFHIKINILGLTTLGYIELEQELKQTDTPTALHQLSAWRNLRDRLRKRTDTWSFSSGPFSARRETGR